MESKMPPPIPYIPQIRDTAYPPIDILKTLWHTIPCSMFIADLTGVIQYWNRSAEWLTGYSAEEVVGKHCSFLGGENCDADCFIGPGKCGLLHKKAVYHQRCAIVAKDGKEISIFKNARVLMDASGKPVAIAESMMDISTLVELETRVETLEREVDIRSSFHRLIGKSRPMQTVYQQVQFAAESDATALIIGETGTGKELVARTIHEHSARKKGPFVAVSCAALPESLVESELFGHVAGAFTGAIKDKKGRFERANGGTLLLDEVDDLPPNIQLKLLRVLEERMLERVGDTRPFPVDVRIIAATKRELSELVEHENFRADLFYRLNVFVIRLAPLRKRMEDIPLLLREFIDYQNLHTPHKHISGVTESAMRLLMDYSWPGNIRELRNVVEHAFVVLRAGRIGVQDLPREIRENSLSTRPPLSAALANPTSGEPALEEEDERQNLLHLLQHHRWNKSAVGRQLGISHTAVAKRMKRMGIPLKRMDS